MMRTRTSFAKSLLLLAAVILPAFALAQSQKCGANIAASVAHKGADGASVTNASLGLINTTDTLRGATIGLVSSRVNGSATGLNLGGFNAVALGDVSGAQISGAANAVGGTARGLQFGIATNAAAALNGVQISPLSNVTIGPMHGLQFSAVSNIAMGVPGGIQIAAANFATGRMRGAQLGAYCFADTLSGAQVGLVNVATHHPKGPQIGIVNVTGDTKAVKIGLVNINPTTRIDAMAFAGTEALANTMVRFRNRSTYSMLGLGYFFSGLDHKFSGAATYRLGQYFATGKRLSLSGDVGFSHIESFQHNSTAAPERLYALHAHLNADYQITRVLGLYASVGYGTTRHYHHDHHFRDRASGELGLTFDLQHESRSIGREAESAAGAVDRSHGMRFAVSDSLRRFAENAPWNKKKLWWRAAAEVAGINVFVHCFDRWVTNSDFAQTTLHSLGRNFRKGFVWDNDVFSTNCFAHPYHGNLYFNAARSSGMNFWESYPYALGGSLMWEMLGETDPPALNDLFATSFGGAAIGEITNRVSKLILDDRKSGFPRFLREAGALIVNPMQGFNRLITGEAWRVRHEYFDYHDEARFPVDFAVSVGSRYLADDRAYFRGEFNPYLTLFLEYGDAFNAEENRPYDFFSAEATFGFSSNQPIVNGLHLLGKLWSTTIYEGRKGKVMLGFFQHFNYFDSEPVKDGTQLTPYRISESASLGPGIMMSLPNVGIVERLDQRVYLSGILLGGTKSDYYNFIDRDYNMGSGYSVKSKTHLEMRRMGRFVMKTDFYHIFTWKGYAGKNLETVDLHFLNAQGDKGNAMLLVLNPFWQVDLGSNLSLEVGGSYFMRRTHYSHLRDIHAETFETKVGLVCHF